MKIGIDARLQNETGVGRYIRNLTYYLPKLDPKNEYIFLHPEVAWHSIQEQLQMPGIFNREKLDLVHVPYFNVPYFYNKPYVITIHDLIINEFDTGMASTRNPLVYTIKRFGYQQIMQKAVSTARGIIVPSNATREMVLKHYPSVDSEKVYVTYEGIDRGITHPTGKKFQKPGNQIGGPFFLYVGNAYPHKNLELLISAFSRINKPNIQLVLVGKMDYFYYRILEQVKKLGISDRVILTGMVTDEELTWLYKNAKALVLPSLMEGFGLPAVEAMHHRCLVVASDIPAFNEVCQDAALYFDPKSEQSLFEIIQSVLADKDQVKINIRLKKGTEYASKFSWKKMVKETIQVYERCLGL
ncbi:MAG: glycosyltransferase family 1 protein [Victivallaceae bacterium]|nr:glycosyltransferase family 1 protein [Victivallaceae bacterium]